jgi:SHS2 domain-containing protein
VIVKSLETHHAQVDQNLNAEETAPEWLEFLDHTADGGILVQAPDLKELFARAAWGMFSLVTDVDTIRPVERSRFRIEAGDLSALMVSWLSELNYRHVTEHRLFGKFSIIEIGEKWLFAEVEGERLDPTRHKIFTEIKAVTFHDLRVERDDRGWKTQIIFDL